MMSFLRILKSVQLMDYAFHLTEVKRETTKYRIAGNLKVTMCVTRCKIMKIVNF